MACPSSPAAMRRLPRTTPQASTASNSAIWRMVDILSRQNWGLLNPQSARVMTSTFSKELGDL